MLSDRFSSAPEIRNGRNEVTNDDACERTARRRLAESNMHALSPARGPDLLVQDRTARLVFLKKMLTELSIARRLWKELSSHKRKQNGFEIA